MELSLAFVKARTSASGRLGQTTNAYKPLPKRVSLHRGPPLPLPCMKAPLPTATSTPANDSLPRYHVVQKARHFTTSPFTHSPGEPQYLEPPGQLGVMYPLSHEIHHLSREISTMQRPIHYPTPCNFNCADTIPTFGEAIITTYYPTVAEVEE